MQPGRFGKAFLGDAGGAEMGADALDAIVDHGAQENTSGCEKQGANHTEMGLACVSKRSMGLSADDRREILRRFMVENGLKAARWAKESGVSANSIYNFLNKESDALDLRTYGKLARTAQVPVWKLNGDVPEPSSPTEVWVSGYVEAGAWREAVEWDRSKWFSVDVPVPPRFRGRARALEVRGTSMNLVFPEGSIAIWVPLLEFRAPQDGDDVIVYRHRHDGTIEATVKTLKVVSGKRWLWPNSSDPLHQAPVEVDNPGEDIASIEIEGIVIGDYRPRIF